MKRFFSETLILCIAVLFISLKPACAQLYANHVNPTPAAVKEHFDVEKATTAYMYQLTPEQKKRSDRYFEGGYWIALLDLAVELLLAWMFLSLGLSQWIYKKTGRLKRLWIKNFVYILAYFVLVFLISFPVSVYTGFIREHQFGLSNLSFGGWLSESMISLALSSFFMGILLVILYWVMNKTKHWWLICSGIVFLFVTFVFFIQPVFLSPIFNEYKPLEDGIIKDEILSMARANGVPADEVYQFNASKQTTRVSANVSGIGSTIRISLNDNLLNKCSKEEIRAVMAHELGHYVLNHMVKMLVAFGILIIAGFAFMKWFMELMLKRFGIKWGITGVGDIRSLPVFVLTLSLFMFLSSPLVNNIIRINETEADIFGLNTAHEPDGFAKVALKLSEYRKMDPGKLEEILFFDHPSGKTRIYNAMRWKAENHEKVNQ